MSTQSSGPKGTPKIVRILLLLLLVVLLLLLVAYAAVRSLPPEALRTLLGRLVTATPTVAAPASATPTSTPIVLASPSATPSEAATPEVGTPIVLASPSATPPGTATPTLIPLTVVPSPTPSPTRPAITPSPTQPAVTPSPTPLAVEPGIITEELPTPTPFAPPTPTSPPRITPPAAMRITTAEVVRNGDFAAEFQPGGIAAEWEVFHNGSATFWGYPDIWPAQTGESIRAQALHIRDAALADRYIGIYQTVNVVSGGSYTFTIAGMVRTPVGNVQETGYGYRMQVGFDPLGGRDWRKVETWIELPWDEQRLGQEPYRLETFTTTVTASSPQLTIFVRAWKKWADAGEGIYDIARVSLTGPVITPAPAVALPPTVVPPPTPTATPLVVAALPTPTATPAVAVAEAVATPAVPVTGGILDMTEEAGRTAVTVLLVALLLLGGMLYRWRPWSSR